MSDAFQNNPLGDAQQTYSPLPMMVQRFREMYGGRPAPAPPPNLEQQAAMQQPNTDAAAWKQPRRENLALPPGAPSPRPAPFQSFRPASIARAPHQWGQEEQFPQLPHGFEIPGIAKGLSNYYSQNGGANVAQIAMMMGPFAGSFLEGIQQGQHERAQAAREQLALHMERLKERATEQLTAYSDIVGEYTSLDPTLGRTIKGRSVMDALHGKAVEIGDIGPGSLGELIEAGAKPSDVRKFLEHRDLRLRDLHKANAAMQDDTVERQNWGMDAITGGQPGQADTSAYGGLRDPGETAAAPAAPAAVDPVSGQPAPAPAPAAKLPGDKEVAGPGAPSDADTTPPGGETATTSGDPNNPLPRWAGKDNPAIAEIHKALKDNKFDPEIQKTDPALFKSVMLGTDQANSFLDHMLRNPPQDRSKILPMVRALDPGMASDVQGILNYDFPASGGQSGTGASPGTPSGQYSNRLRQIAESITNGKWNQGYFQRQQDLIKNNQTQQTLGRITTMGDAGAQMMEALDNMPPGANSSNFIMRGARTAVGKLTGEGVFAARDAAWLRYNEELNTVIKSTGGSLTELEAALHNVNPYTGTPEAYRRVMAQDAEIAKDRMEQIDTRFHAIGGRGHLPGFDEAAYDKVMKIANTEPVNNKQPGEIIIHPDGTRMKWMGMYDKDGRKLSPSERYQQVE
jgi:hypothetical protein